MNDFWFCRYGWAEKSDFRFDRKSAVTLPVAGDAAAANYTA